MNFRNTLCVKCGIETVQDALNANSLPNMMWARRVRASSGWRYCPLLRGPPDSRLHQPVSRTGLFPGAAPLELERQLERHDWENDGLLARARSAMAILVDARLGGDCWAPDPGAESLGLQDRGSAIVVVQENHDLNPQGRINTRAALQLMLDSVSAECAGNVVVFAPRTSLQSSRFPHDEDIVELSSARGWRLITHALSPWTILDAANVVYTIGHEIGLLALLRGQAVRCFGRPYYAGWGLTNDDPEAAPRSSRRLVEEIFAVTCLLNTRYIDPYTQGPYSFEEACAYLKVWRRTNEENRRIAVCTGMSFWKRPRMTEFLRSTDGKPVFRRRVASVVRTARKRGGAIAVWGPREQPELAEAANRAGIPIVRIEDGFLRSVGLGADFLPGASIVLDRRGIYYDPATESDLEAILSQTTFNPQVIERARQLINLVVARGITKYNVGATMADIAAPADRRSIFVPGQVTDDRSVLLGGQYTNGNLQMLQRVRELNSDAFIVYKPHPDVDAGHRHGALPDKDVSRFADRLLRGVSSAAIIAAVDEVHTLTSLAGFEALLRGRRVVVHGQPFYAGWGLTTDLMPIPRRRRHLSLEELVAGTLILYPRYLDPRTRLPCEPELIIERFADVAVWKTGMLVRLRRLQGILARRSRAMRPLPSAASRLP